MIKKSKLLLTLLVLVSFIVNGQDARNFVSLGMGVHHSTLLDKQATPIIHSGIGGYLDLSYEHRTTNNYWRFECYAGKQAYHIADKSLRVYTDFLSATTAGLDFTYMRHLKQKDQFDWFLGASVMEEVLVDFDKIGNWPYVSAPGGVNFETAVIWNPSKNHDVTFEFGLPIFSWITDMPYNQIPRIIGEAPSARTLFKTGTRVTSWKNYQRFDIKLKYDFDLNDRWSLRAMYDWSWMHDNTPRDMWLYQGRFTIGGIVKW